MVNQTQSGQSVFLVGCFGYNHIHFKTRMPNVMAALSNIGGALCSTPQNLADDHYYSAVQ